MPRSKRWPSRQTVLEKAKKGIIDDTTAAVPPWDFLDVDESPADSEERAAAKRGAEAPRARPKGGRRA